MRLPVSLKSLIAHIFALEMTQLPNVLITDNSTVQSRFSDIKFSDNLQFSVYFTT